MHDPRFSAFIESSLLIEKRDPKPARLLGDLSLFLAIGWLARSIRLISLLLVARALDVSIAGLTPTHAHIYVFLGYNTRQSNASERKKDNHGQKRASKETIHRLSHDTHTPIPVYPDKDNPVK
jgi:hypothetical protein